MCKEYVGAFCFSLFLTATILASFLSFCAYIFECECVAGKRKCGADVEWLTGQCCMDPNRVSQHKLLQALIEVEESLPDSLEGVVFPGTYNLALMGGTGQCRETVLIRVCQMQDGCSPCQLSSTIDGVARQ